MTAPETAEVRELLGAILGDETVAGIGDGDLFFEEAIIDSLQLLSIVEEFRARFGVEVSGSELSPENFGSIDAMARFLADKRGGG